MWIGNAHFDSWKDIAVMVAIGFFELGFVVFFVWFFSHNFW